MAWTYAVVDKWDAEYIGEEEDDFVFGIVAFRR